MWGKILRFGADTIRELPIEKWVFRPPDRSCDMEKMKMILTHSQEEQQKEAAAAEHHNHHEFESHEEFPDNDHDGVELATTEDTIIELKRRLGKEIYRMELDLQGGGRINGKVCDCLGAKHSLGLESCAEELMSYESNPVFQDVIDWLHAHQHDFIPRVIASHEKSYYQDMIPEVRKLRKRVMGTDDVKALFTPEETDSILKLKKQYVIPVEANLDGEPVEAEVVE
jgi:tyrosine-protein phosphatase YwqE